MDLRPRWRLNSGDSLYSPLGGFRCILQGDGNLVLYVIDDMRIPEDVTPILLHTEETKDIYHIPIWQTGTNTPGQTAGTGDYCIMNDGGNFVVYDEHDHPCFQSGTRGNPGLPEMSRRRKPRGLHRPRQEGDLAVEDLFPNRQQVTGEASRCRAWEASRWEAPRCRALFLDFDQPVREAKSGKRLSGGHPRSRGRCEVLRILCFLRFLLFQYESHARSGANMA